jgi:HD-GYP domain-containing protein (c-di-GMP phosphodiesterase class II)
MPAVARAAAIAEKPERLLTPAEIEEGFESENSVRVVTGDEAVSALHGTLLDALGSVTSYIRYRTRHLLVVAANFDKELTEIDGQIFKSLFVSMSALRTIANQMKDIESLFHYTVEALARAAEANDEDTFTHISRINQYSAVLARSMGLDSQFIEDIGYMAQMHDVGKIQVDASILRKNGRLTSEEFEKMKLHTVYGARIIGDHPRLRMAKEIAMSHHEKWDGSGYPLGLGGEEIPLSARIVAIVDVYDALRSRRPYKEPQSHDSAMEIITHGDERTVPTHFDPVIKSAFVKINKKLDDIYRENEE